MSVAVRAFESKRWRDRSRYGRSGGMGLGTEDVQGGSCRGEHPLQGRAAAA
jgi:hypothetical protein